MIDIDFDTSCSCNSLIIGRPRNTIWEDSYGLPQHFSLEGTNLSPCSYPYSKFASNNNKLFARSAQCPSLSFGFVGYWNTVPRWAGHPRGITSSLSFTLLFVRYIKLLKRQILSEFYRHSSSHIPVDIKYKTQLNTSVRSISKIFT